VSLDVQRGEAIGIIGRNGAGKSTLLKILSRITEPTSGRVILDGRVASLLEVGTGFHPELTGRENIYLNGAILGMKKAEIIRKFDEIVEFAEIARFLDTPVKRYSSGMYVRLAFAVAAHLESEILLVDEVLAVGDAAFQKKCLGKMGDVAHEGRTVLFVSHNMAAVENLCGRAVLLSEGSIKASGDIASVIKLYLTPGQAVNRPLGGSSLATSTNGSIELLSIAPVDDDGQALSFVRCGDDLNLCVELRVTADIPDAIVTVGLNNSNGTRVTVLHSSIAGYALSLRSGICSVICRVSPLPLSPAEYYMDVRIFSGYESVLWAPNLGPITVESADFYHSGKSPDPRWAGFLYLNQQWDVVA
jgi:lipopolysaccharide transport system ATP-binding protein